MAQLLKMKVIKPNILKKNGFNDTLLEREFRQSADRVEQAFQKSVSTWKNKPVFEKEFEFGSGFWRYKVFTTNKVYMWVNDGTRAHDISAKKPGGVLLFPSSRVPKTKPGRLQSAAGSQSSHKTMVFPNNQPVKHPGVEPRKFDELIATREMPKLIKKMNTALAKSIQRSS